MLHAPLNRKTGSRCRIKSYRRENLSVLRGTKCAFQNVQNLIAEWRSVHATFPGENTDVATGGGFIYI